MQFSSINPPKRGFSGPRRPGEFAAALPKEGLTLFDNSEVSAMRGKVEGSPDEF